MSDEHTAGTGSGPGGLTVENERWERLETGPAVAVSVVIPCYNSADTLAQQLEALARQCWSGSWEVIVADNGSADRSAEVSLEFAERLPSLRVIDASGRRGSAYARNEGARVARGRSVVFCDADDVVADGWLAAIANALEKHSFVASRHEFELLNEPAVLAARHPVQVSELQHLWYPPYLDHAGGCGLGLHKDLFDKYGGFSEDYLSLQDTEYCVRLELAGVPLHFVSDAIIHIRCRERSDSLFRQARSWAFHNVLICRQYRRPGEPVPGGWKAWFRELRRLVHSVRQYVRVPERRASLVWQYGWQLGLLQGALRGRIPPVALDSSEWKNLASRATD